MSKELVISANRHETRVALIEDDQLVEVYFQRANEYSLAGSIHKGRVTRVLPGMQSAFVDLGLERDTFLYVSDFLEEHEDIDRVTGDEPRPRERDNRDRDRDRERRPAGPPPLPPTVAAPAPVLASAPANGATSEPTAVVAAAPPAPMRDRGPERGPDRGPDRGDSDRRGRRSRRRRNRGRGFPDSKYADGGAPATAAPAAVPTAGPTSAPVAAAEVVVAEPVVAPASTEATLILPGESLAKYRGAPASEPRAAEPEEVEVAESENEFDEPIHFLPENALPDAPRHVQPPPLPPSAFANIEAPSEEDIAMEVPEEVADAEEAAESGPVSVAFLDEDEDRDIQAMILGDPEEADEEDVAASEEESAEEAAPTDPGGEAVATSEGMPEPNSGTAQVREQGGRYPHRVSRQRRRRGGRPQDGRDSRGPEGQGRPEQDRAPERERTVSAPQQSAQSSSVPSIADLLKEGQEIIVQIAKEPLGQKGARITSHIALPGRFVVYMPTLEHMGVSRKIGSDEERLRLKRVLQGRRPGPVGGFITRTAAEGRSEEEIAADMQFLYNLWQDIRNKAERRPAPMLLHHDLDIVQRILRDQLADSFKAIWIDNEEIYESVLSFVQRFQPGLVGKVKLYTREAPIFDAFSVTNELEKALRPKVWLKSGGFIVINQTEALVAGDVNTGKYVGKTNRLEDTIVKTNTEAIKEIVRQIRLRDLGGIIVIDFIDMDERKNRQKVMQTLEEAMRVDRAPYKILQFNDFGLVAITRKRVKQSLERTLCAPCPHCDGAGYIKSTQTVVSEILAEARKMSASVEGKDVMLRVHPDVAKVLKSNQNKYLEELEEVLRRPVLVKSDPLLHHEKFDLA